MTIKKAASGSVTAGGLNRRTEKSGLRSIFRQDRMKFTRNRCPNPLNVYRTVQELIAAGAAGRFLKDQLWPKKCGHMKGKRVVERDEYVQKIRAAVEARGDRDFFIVARTDALAVVGMEEAVHRILAAREAGADASFIEAPDSLEQLAGIGRRVPRPMVANMIEGGRTPVLPRDNSPRWASS